MKKRVLAYLAYIDELLEKENVDWEAETKKHLVQIGFFAHERLVHLIVMVLFALMTTVTILYCNYTNSMIALVLTIALLVLLIPYIMHYYLLENSVQRMYTQYDKMMKKQGEAFELQK
ncbi:MAG: hypothetical protein IJX85_09925 [Lachnospiraceae bacterium]|nr:hypothetical protein [Lachnospiraceae bacterium]